ncbi:hypothetical protein CERSUDRAFT_89250 [Gelatoporia subvermispora B]|uniref:Uncharacterized protein n=1 Tax=Ceriporiopsis subvermispora (strain B) TaxID=914234 RepID=M2Q369_CERS8|nr:hypothetical protein CERSUDRAFT_89250 [Gelatoporia subvermispora B]
MREAWSLDWHSHGWSAVLNQAQLTGVSKVIPVEECIKAIRHFMRYGAKTWPTGRACLGRRMTERKTRMP